jgi:hypothetical protein
VTARREPGVTTVVACAAGALLAVCAGVALGSWRGGVALALGLLVGSVNGLLARRALGLDVSFRVTSLGRLVVLSVAGLGLGALLGLPFVPLVLIGIAAAQLVLAVASTVAAVRA